MAVGGEAIVRPRRARGSIAGRLACLSIALRDDPVGTWRALRRLRLHTESWRRFSLATNGRRCLAEFYSASREAGIRPFLMWGTLLGLVREQRFLTHDRDIDVAILRPDLEHADRLVAAMTRRGFRLRKRSPLKLSFWWRDGILHLDMDVVCAWGGQTVCASPRRGTDYTGLWFPADAFDDLRSVCFVGVKVLIPGNPEAVLEAVYGNWRVPETGYSASRGPLNRAPLPPEALASFFAG